VKTSWPMLLRHSLVDRPMAIIFAAFLLQSVSTQVNLVLGPSKQASISEVLDAIDHGDSMGKERRYWVLDPIDGTRGFMSGDQYAVGLALIVDSRPVLGVLGCPSLAGGCLICGVVNEGATVESILLDDGKGQETLSAPTSAKPSSSSDICEAVFVHGERDTLLDNPELMEAYISSTGQQPAVLSICYGSLAKYAAICIGMGSAFMYLPNIQGVRRCHVWDHASGYACLVAAGGKVTDFHGDDLDFSTGRVIYVKSGLLVSANKSLHTALLSTFGAF